MDAKMQQYGAIGNISCIFAILSSFANMLNIAMNFLNMYGVAFSVIFGGVSTFVAWRYKRKHYELALLKIRIQNNVSMNEINGDD